MAQLPAPNSMGVGMGHLHLSTTDPAAQKKFWVDTLGGTVGKLGQSEIYKFPDAIVVVSKKASVTGGTDGSAVNHLGFRVKDLDTYKKKVLDGGFKIVRDMPATRQIFAEGPDGVWVELSEDTTQKVPITHHHIHFYVEPNLEQQAWYHKMFGSKDGKRGRFDKGDLPGVELTFSKAETATVPTKGRGVDHIGFEIKGLAEFCKKMEAAGVKFDVPYRNVPAIGLAIAFFTDPWGVYVELTEGLDKL